MKEETKRFQDRASKGIEIVIRKMCEVVGCDYDTFNFEQPSWWSVYKWDKTQEEKFIDWMDNKIKSSKTVREAVTNYPRMVARNKGRRKTLITWFLSSYGWAYKDF